jgi:Icc protein
MASSGFRFVHITDTHIMAGGTWPLRGSDKRFDTEASLREVVDAVRALDPAPAFAVLGGDLASPDILHRERVLTATDYEPSYARLGEILAALPCPAHPIPGNHDQREAFNRVLRRVAPEARCYSSFDHDGAHLVLLDSHVPGEAGGTLNAAQLSWLDKDLAGHRDRLTIVFVHHHPWPLGLQWIDAMALSDGPALMTLLARHPQARWVIAGHVHLDQVIQRDGVTLLTSPSTCVQLSKTQQEGAYADEAPGFRVIDVVDGRLSSSVIRVRAASHFTR